MSQNFLQEKLSNGMTLVAEKMAGVGSAAMTLLVDAGAAYDRTDRLGTGAVLSDLLLRGAGQRDSRQLTEYLDHLGLQRSSSVGVYHMRFACAAVAPKVIESLQTYADILCRPMLPADGFEAARDLAVQALAGLDDDPRQLVLLDLRAACLSDPLGRNPMGAPAALTKLDVEHCRSHWTARCRAGGTILALAGNIDFAQIKAEAEQSFADFPAGSAPSIELKPVPRSSTTQHTRQTEQTHIGIGYPSVTEIDPDFYVVRLATEVLSGGMSGRLFTEVREKRSLCYNVWAGHSATKTSGHIFCYAGSSPDRAQQTVECLMHEIFRLSLGITQAELDRAKIGLKSALILDGESTTARAGGIAHDLFIRGRIRTLDEIKAEIDVVTLGRVNEYLKNHPPTDFKFVAIGPRELTFRVKV